MKTRTIVAFAFLCVILLSSCAGLYQAPVIPSGGALFADIRAPLDADMGANTNLGSKTGEAMSSSVLGLFASGDSSIQTAAANGKITQIKHVDYEFRNILGIYSSFTTIVYGD